MTKSGSFALAPADVSRQISSDRYFFYNPGHTLTTVERAKLEQEGIEILYTLKNNLYWVRIKDHTSAINPLFFFSADPAYKVGLKPDNRNSFHELRVSVAPGLHPNEIAAWAQLHDIVIKDERPLHFGFIDIMIPSVKWPDIVNTPWISYIEEIPSPEAIHHRYLLAERGWNLIGTHFRGLDGTGMTIGIGDEGRIGLHDDLSANLLDNASFGISNHSTEVAGVITGAGNVDPFYGRGYAPKARVIIRNFTDILWDAPVYFSDYGMTLTNNSYGAALSDCAYIGDYNGTSMALDNMMNAYPSLLHVFASANSGGMTCPPYPVQYATVAGGYQTSKNVLTVGAVNITDAVVGFSSRGPVDDGRLKPEVVAGGQNRLMTIDGNNYTGNSGTSFSCPATMGLATLLYERYKQLHSDSLPEAALIKNIICNSADDIGNPGPDYPSGFGRINGDRAATIIENHQYTGFTIDHQSTVTRTFAVPSGTSSADVMLMWSDVSSAPYETQTIVNDLDLIVIDPAGDTIKPWKLNNIPSGVGQSAIRDEDHLNNYEQVTISNAIPGSYTVIVNGFDIPMGPQKAWITWDLHQTGIKVQSPNGGEVFRPGIPPSANEKHYIRWDAHGTGNSTFTVEFSNDGGTNWETIATALPPASRYQEWFVDDTHTDKLLVKVTASNGMTDTSDFHATIMAPPTGFTAASPCNGYLQLSWNAVAGAHHYEIFRLKDEQLEVLDTTSTTSIILSGLSPDTAYWFGVAGVFASGKPGLRTRGLLRTANGGNNCNWDHDLRLNAITNPVTGRAGTQSAPGNAESISVQIENLGDLDAHGFMVHYKIGNGSIITESFNDTIPAHGLSIFTFSQTGDFSAPGTFMIKAWTSYLQDMHLQNDTIIHVMRSLANPVVSLPYAEDFENVTDQTLTGNYSGIEGLTSWDVSLHAPCRVRTFAGTPFCFSGERAFTLDASKISANQSGELILTLNLGNYNVTDDDVRLSFQYMHHELIPDGNNSEAVWIRGNDSASFVQLILLPNESSKRGAWQSFAGIKLGEVLQNAGQHYSSSFQIKFAFQSYAPAGQPEMQDGFTIDNLEIQVIEKDVRSDAIVYPPAIACGLNEESLQISLTNTSDQDVAGVVVSFRIDDGPVHNTSIGTIRRDTTIVYTLSPTIDFSETRAYQIEAWISTSDDLFHANDTIRTIISHSPYVFNLPYTEGFESDAGGWLSGGVNNSWQHGIPGKSIIAGSAEGDKSWTTALTGTHNADELSYLYSPCFDLEGIAQPYLSFALQYQLEVNYDYAWVEYRMEGSSAWIKLGSQGSGTNWYNHNSNSWNGSQLKWITSGHSIPVTDTTVQFRWVMYSDVGVEFEGIAIDQIHVYDKVPVYTGGAMAWTIPVSGNNWVHFDHNNQRVFSIHPDGQDLGNVTLTLYKSGQNFLTGDSLYLLSRSWVINPSILPQNAVDLRAYFTVAESNFLVNASGCTQCIPASDGFDLTSLRYSGPNEDGSFSNNTAGLVESLSPDSVMIQPYEQGYYAEWTSDSLSEWWITTRVTHAKGTIERKITSQSDDAEEHETNGAVNPVREFIAMTEYDGKQMIGLRFRDLTIPSGSYIASASLQLFSTDTAAAPTDLVLRMQEIADAPGFNTSTYNISQRNAFNSVLYWSPSTWADSTTYSSHEMRHLIQEVIDQAGWKPGNDVVVLIEGSGFRECRSYDGDPVKAPRLMIQYDEECFVNGRLYVDHDASGIQDGSSWEDAYRTVQQALDQAEHCSDVNEIWVAGGTYTFNPDAERTLGFKIREGLQIYGGFEGNETSVNQRVYGAFPTVLSGETGSIVLTSDNLYHVVTILPGDDIVLLDGFMISHGFANGIAEQDQRGSGLDIRGKLQCRQVILSNNSSPAVYTAPGSEISAIGAMEVRP